MCVSVKYFTPINTNNGRACPYYSVSCNIFHDWLFRTKVKIVKGLLTCLGRGNSSGKTFPTNPDSAHTRWALHYTGALYVLQKGCWICLCNEGSRHQIPYTVSRATGASRINSRSCFCCPESPKLPLLGILQPVRTSPGRLSDTNPDDDVFWP